MTPRRVDLVLITVVLVALFVLAVRPYFPSFYERMYGLDVGGWVMYRYDLVSEPDVRLVAGDERIRIDARDHIWHNALANSPHPHFTEGALEAFLAELATKPSVRELIEANGAEKLTLDLKLVKNKRYWKTVSVEHVLP